MEDGSVRVGFCNQGSRKRKRNESKRDKMKKTRYSAPRGMNIFRPCLHNTKAFLCSKITPNAALRTRKRIYNVPDKTVQDNIVANLVSIENVKRQRPRQNKKAAKNQQTGKPKPHAFSVKYYLCTLDKKRYTVCKKCFMHVTGFKTKRLSTLSKKICEGISIQEKRGGDRVSYKSLAKKERVREFLSNLHGWESHYNRKKSKRIYLHSDLNRRKLTDLYNANVSPNFKVSKSMFRKIFLEEFNIGFRTPSSDMCSFCYRIDSEIRLEKKKHEVEQNINKIKDLILQKCVHKKKAKAFRTLLHKANEGDELTFCFDLQQVQPLPKASLAEAFYLRQLNFYVLGVVNPQTKNPVFYSWSENEAGRGSVEISSALSHFLSHLDLSNVRTVRLFCDGCPGQNKNNIVVRSLIHFLGSPESPQALKQIELTFPVRGHSFLPADRVFGRVEKLLRKRPVIENKEQYYKLYSEVGEVRKLGVDWHLFDFKVLSQRFKNVDGIKMRKRIFIKKFESSRILVKATEHYHYESPDETFKQLQKKGWGARRSFLPVPLLDLGHAVSAEKKADIESLLATMSHGDWKENPLFVWFKDIVYAPENEVAVANNHDDIEECDCLEEEDEAFHI